MKHLHHKLNSRRGETLTETLCAMVVISLSSVLLATMLTAAAHLNQRAITEDETRAEERTIAEIQPPAPTAEGGIITAKQGGGGGDDGALAVILHRKKEGALTSFSYSPPNPPPESEAGESAP